MKILLLEDEMIVVRDLTSRLNEMGYMDIQHFDNGAEFLKAFDSDGADLCLVDINIRGSIDGVQTVKKIPEDKRVPIIYITAQADHQTFTEAKMTRPSAYLIKPYNAFELQTSIELAVETFEEQSQEDAESKGVKVIDDKIFIKHQSRYDRVKLNEICYMEAFGNYTEIHTETRRYTVVTQLGKLEKSLQESFLFRCHRSYIINLNEVLGFDESAAYILEKTIPIAKNQRQEFLSRLRVL